MYAARGSAMGSAGAILVSARREGNHGYRRGNESCAGGAIQPVGDLVEAVVEEVAVQIEGHRRGLMTEHLLHDLHVGACGDREAGSRVAQAVRHEAVKAGPSRRRCEHVAPEVAGTQGLALRRGEHEIVRPAAGNVLAEPLGDEARHADPSPDRRHRAPNQSGQQHQSPN